MLIYEQTILTFAGALSAGLVGSLTGLGGGVIVVPLLTLLFKVNIRYAIGASLVSVIATSSGAASAYVKEGYTNLRIAMFLEIATVIGAMTGAVIASKVPTNVISVIFGVTMLQSAFMSSQPRRDNPETPSTNPLFKKLNLDSTYPTPNGPQPYTVQAVPQGFCLMGLAGVVSGLLGIGSGALKVIAMDRVMRIPFKVSTTTSNFMIGVTAAASAAIYWNRGYIDPGLSMPIMLGVLVGSLLGAHLLMKLKVEVLRILFGSVIFILGLEMIFNGFFGVMK